MFGLAEVTQLVEFLPSKQAVAGSSPVFRSRERFGERSRRHGIRVGVLSGVAAPLMTCVVGNEGLLSPLIAGAFLGEASILGVCDSVHHAGRVF